MRTKWLIIKKYSPWFAALFITDIFFLTLLWVADVQAFFILSCVLILGTLLLFGTTLTLVLHGEIKRRNAFEDYVDLPSELNEEVLLRLCSKSDEQLILLAGRKIREQQRENEQLLTRISDYEEYVEGWAHETKTPISLLTILLDNRKDEIQENISLKLDYIRNRIQEYVNQMLFYARLKGRKKDYLFENLGVAQCLEEVMEDYKTLLEEKHFHVSIAVQNETVYSDYRGLKFLLSQIMSNSLKYTRTDNQPELCIASKTDNDQIRLLIKDNGIGVRPNDLPYIFEKGFTGDSGDHRKKATGMGLYLARAIAEDLNLELEVESEWMKGFEMEIVFPQVPG